MKVRMLLIVLALLLTTGMPQTAHAMFGPGEQSGYVPPRGRTTHGYGNPFFCPSLAQRQQMAAEAAMGGGLVGGPNN